MRYIILLVLGFLLIHSIQAQNENTKPPAVTFSGALEAYYNYDFNRPDSSKNRPDFLYSHNRHNEFNVNMALIQANVDGEFYRANVGLMAGTFPQANMSHEPTIMQFIYEANAGIQLFTPTLWLDAGIFSSHLGFESAIGTENPTLTRSILAEESPYYLAGAKLYYTPNEYWDFGLTICNGWQNIMETDQNTNKALGTQVTYKKTDKLTVNYSTFLGYETPDSAKQWRFFQDLYLIWNPSEQWQLITGFDIGLQQNEQQTAWNNWWSPILIAQYKPTDRWSMAVRTEYFQDINGVLRAENFKTFGTSYNIDFNPSKFIKLRLEGRYFYNIEQQFINAQWLASPHNFALTTALSCYF